ncbi:MAG: LysR family transcriptional regulator [Edaphobacter sp.]|uniref:LysR family transcriptional regulator n=1 Tax=Edaphobacter sp. TaxID=1934404 RepID=UPI0023A74A4B|nr:LysR family transcriptional regulator [Edaphobacter sp.]MDE1175891.1 LysR family transcriptional regulator [Edaphobacter sp.]
MQEMDNLELDKIDFRSLRLLNVLLETASVTKAGEALAISQPAASRVLAQLRLALGDPLLVRGRRGNTLTPRAEALRPLVAEALDAVSTLFVKDAFEPKSAKLRLRVATTDYGAATVLAPLARQLAVSAPAVTIEIAPWSAQTLTALESGRLDLALYAESKLPENFHSRALFRDKYACLVRRGHPVLSKLRRDGSMNPRAAALYPQIVLLYPDGDQLVGEDVLTQLGHPPERIAMRTPYFTSAPLLLSNTDNMILLPSLLARTLTKSAPVVQVALHADTEFGYRLIWHERTQKDRGIRWIRTQIYKLFSRAETGAEDRVRERDA